MQRGYSSQRPVQGARQTAQPDGRIRGVRPMSACSRFESMVESLVASDLDRRALSDLLAHAAGCESCRQLLAIHGDLVEAGERVPEPAAADLDRRQERVLLEIGQRKVRRPLLRLAALAAGLILPLAAGILAGRALPRRTSGVDPASRLMDAIQ